MNVMRFVGKTSGEAMRKLRDALGPDALVLANRPCAEGVELLAAAPGTLGPLDPAPRRAEPARPREAAPRRTPGAPVADGRATDEEVAAASMSTVSFQDYVRQRLRERSQGGGRAETDPVPQREAAARPRPASASPVRERAASVPAPAPAMAAHGDRGEPAGRTQRVEPRERTQRVELFDAARRTESEERTRRAETVEPHARATREEIRAERPAAPVRREPALDGPDAPRGFAPGWGRADGPGADAHEPLSRDPVRAATPPGPAPFASDALVAEMQSLKGMISRQFATISWFEGVRRSPTQGRLLRTMVAAGFSLKLARSVVTRLPSDYSDRDAQVWLEEVLARNLRCASPAQAFEGGGVFALIGPTGVGKTTTTAKIAARQVLKHGPQSVALITVDTYRLGAHDQLRAFGRILGVPVHIAHDASALHDLLRLRSTRQMVLVDTVGMGHRDERIRSLLMSLPRNDIKHVVVASCAAQAETIDESLRAYEARQAHGVVLTKLDEAARTGGAIDCLLRQRLQLLGTCDGQRVPEDWQPADAGRLVRRALLAPQAGAFGLEDEELPLVFGVAATLQGDGAHA